MVLLSLMFVREAECYFLFWGGEGGGGKGKSPKPTYITRQRYPSIFESGNSKINTEMRTKETT